MQGSSKTKQLLLLYAVSALVVAGAYAFLFIHIAVGPGDFDATVGRVE